MRFCLVLIGIVLMGFVVSVQARSGVKLSSGKVVMRVGKTRVLKLGGTNQKVTWRSSNKKVIKVVSRGRNSAVLKAKSAGTAIVAAKAGRKKYKCKVTVKERKNARQTETKRQKESEMDTSEKQELIRINIQIGAKTFEAKLYANATTKKWVDSFPVTLNMKELNGNEKYKYLRTNLPTDAVMPGQIHKGDLMLYGSDCVVLFYDTFPTSYSYTSMGYIEDTTGLEEAVGTGSISVTFSLK